MKVSTCFYIREKERHTIFSWFLNNLKLTELTPATSNEVKQPLGEAYKGFNFLSLTILEGLSPVDYKYEKRGNQYFLSVTFSNEGEEPREYINLYSDALCTIANNLNYRWQTVKYVSNGQVNICSRNRVAATMKDGKVIKMIFVQ